MIMCRPVCFIWCIWDVFVSVAVLRDVFSSLHVPVHPIHEEIQNPAGECSAFPD